MVNSHAPIPIMMTPNERDDLSRLAIEEKTHVDKSGPLSFSIRDAQLLATRLFKDINIDTAALDAQLILAHVLKISRIDVQLESRRHLSNDEADAFWQLVKRRLIHEPIAYIVGKKEFFGIEFLVSKDVLIPRPDTEIVVEKCLELISEHQQGLVFDLCTGSGAIGITLLKERPQIFLEASDISQAALLIASENAKKCHVQDRFKLRHGDLFAAFKKGVEADLIVINPPYIATSEIEKLSPSVRNFEPRMALDGGSDRGLDFYRRIINDAPSYLRKNGYLVMEIGFDQGAFFEVLNHEDLTLKEIFFDLAGNTRGVVLQKR